MWQRNVRCWCNSELTYENCHLQRDERGQTTRGEVEAASDSVRGDSRLCLHPSAPIGHCQGRIVKAHSIQQSRILDSICDAGNHLLTFRTRNRGEDGYPDPERIGINRASTFTGFCRNHDRETFRPIETIPFEGTKEQVFLLGFRALCSEVYARVLQEKMNAITLHHAQRLGNEEVIEAIEAYDAGAQQGRAKTMEDKARYDDALRSGNLNGISGLVIRLAGTQSISATGTTGPEYDFDGQLLQDMMAPLDYLQFSLIKADSGPTAVFTWVTPNEPTTALLGSLRRLDNGQIPHAIVRYAFEHFENIYFSPVWWNGMSEAARQKLRVRALSGLPTLDRGADCLRDDGFRLVDWTVTRVSEV